MTRPGLTEAELVRFGEELGRGLPSGAVVWLEGELGTGKTTLARAIVKGRRGGGGEGGVRSPTYALVHRHDGPRGQIAHVDCYRFSSPEDGADLDWTDLAGGDLLLVEWPGRGGEWVPSPTLRVLLHHTDGDDLRSLEVSGDHHPVVSARRKDA